VNKVKKLLGVVLLAGFLAGTLVVVTWPLAARFNTHMIGEEQPVNDATIFTIWYSWYLSGRWNRLLAEPSLFWKTPLLFTPSGLNLYLTNPCFYSIVPAAVFRTFFGFPADVNLTSLVFLILNGLGLFAAARLFKIERDIALVAAVAFCLSPHTFRTAFELSTDQANLWFMVMAMPCLVLACRRGGWRRIMPAGILLALAGVLYWFNAAFLLVFGLLSLPVTVVIAKRGRRWRPVLRLLVVYLIFGAISLPFLYPFFLQGLTAGRMQGLTPGGLLPTRLAPETAELVLTVDHPGELLFSPWTVLVLVISLFGLIVYRAGRPVHLFWFGMAFIFYLLTLGPHLELVPGKLEIPLPFMLLQYVIPVFRRITFCGRFRVMVNASLVFLMATALSSVFHHKNVKGTARKVSLAVLYIALLLTGYFGRYGRVCPVPGAPKAALGIARYRNMKVVDVPLTMERAVSEGAWYQMFHGFPMLTGPGADIDYGHPPQFDRLMAENQFLQVVAEKQAMDRFTLDELKTAAHSLKELGFGFVIHHRLVDEMSGDEMGGAVELPQNATELKTVLRQVCGNPRVVTRESDVYLLP